MILSFKLLLLIFSLLYEVKGVYERSSDCPCASPDLCKVATPNNTHEVLAFSTYWGDRPVPINWRHYAWDKITTLVAHSYPDAELQQAMCHAHSHGSRIIIMQGYPDEQLLNRTYRAAWVKQLTLYIQTMHVDGVNIDFEGAIYSNETELVRAYTGIITDLHATLKGLDSNYQVSIDASWAPFCNDSTMCYDYLSISRVTDYLFIMAYDEQSQIFPSNPCYAQANAGRTKTTQGLKEFLRLGIPAHKLVLGVPWYGYSYRCLVLAENNTCYIEHKQFRTSDCTDIVGIEVSYSIIQGQLLPNSTSGRLWCDKEQSPYLNFKDEKGVTRQVWYDDVPSLKLKYTFIADMGLRGVGMWAAESLDYTRASDVQDMWGALPDYKTT